jgi:hypothetical protein
MGVILRQEGRRYEARFGRDPERGDLLRGASGQIQECDGTNPGQLDLHARVLGMKVMEPDALIPAQRVEALIRGRHIEIVTRKALR